jgi:hypothetical protein
MNLQYKMAYYIWIKQRLVVFYSYEYNEWVTPENRLRFIIIIIIYLFFHMHLLFFNHSAAAALISGYHYHIICYTRWYLYMFVIRKCEGREIEHDRRKNVI